MSYIYSLELLYITNDLFIYISFLNILHENNVKFSEWLMFYVISKKIM